MPLKLVHLTSQWPLMTYQISILITTIYILIVTVLGPKFMKNRAPLAIPRLLKAYNLVQVLQSAWIFYELGAGGWFGRYNCICQPLDFTVNGQRMNAAVWWYYFSKYTDFLDTVFFIARKNFRQVTVLHVFHHAIMPIYCLLTVKYTPNGHFTFPAFINSFIHIVMYSYYFLSSFGPSVQKFLWWKKYLTLMQIVQFIVVFGHAQLPLFVKCDVPEMFSLYHGALSTVLLLFFAHFYFQSYSKNAKAKK